MKGIEGIQKFGLSGMVYGFPLWLISNIYIYIYIYLFPLDIDDGMMH
jgi:hypothetical protein